MKPKEIEALVRQFASISLAIDTVPQLHTQVDLSDLLNSNGFLDPNTTLETLNQAIRSSNSFSNPRWLRDGRIINNSLTLGELRKRDDIHPNRLGDPFNHQLELLRSRIEKSIGFQEVDDIFTDARKLIKQAESLSQSQSVMTVLEGNNFWSVSFRDEHRSAIKNLLERNQTPGANRV